MGESGGRGLGMTVLDWVATYGLHSTVALGLAFVVERTGLLKGPAARDVLWKTAFVMGIVTATVAQVAPLGTATAGKEDVHIVRQNRRVGPALTRPAGPGARRAEWVEGAGAVEPLRVRAMLHNPSEACRQSIRAGMAAGRPAIPAIRSACAGSPWMARLPKILLGVWCVGFLGLLARQAARRRALGTLLERRTEVTGGYARQVVDDLLALTPGIGPVRLFRVDGLESPAALGPHEIGLPARAESLPSDELRVALAHELGHIARHDPRWSALLSAVGTVLFFQPLNLLARRRLRETSELLADDWAVERTGAPLSLARSLARVSDWLTPARPAPALAMAGAEGAPLTRRVERILSDADRRPASRSLRLWLAVALFAGAMAVPSISMPTPPTFELIGDPAALEMAETALDGRAVHMDVLINVERGP